MKYIYLAFLVFTLINANAESVIGPIETINPVTKTFSISIFTGDSITFQTKVTTQIILSGKPSDFDKLSKGIFVQVSKGEKGIAQRIISPPSGKYSESLPSTSEITLKADVSQSDPFIVGRVSAGQKITILAKKVSWSGGGSKRGKFCDWQGYRGTNIEGIPWMAVVAKIGKHQFLVKDNLLSFESPVDGFLMLYVNDDKPRDNVGEAKLTIESSAK